MGKVLVQDDSWTKEDYLRWKETRGEAGTWTHYDCIKADRFVKDLALTTFKQKLTDIPEPIRSYLLDMVRYTYGSSETAELLSKLNCYPDWL